MLVGLCDEYTLPTGGTPQYFRNDGGWMRSCTKLAIMVELEVGEGGESIEFKAQLSPQGETWHDVYIEDWTSAQVSNTLAADITLTADTTQVIGAIPCTAPLVRLKVTNNGATSAELTARLIRIP